MSNLNLILLVTGQNVISLNYIDGTRLSAPKNVIKTHFLKKLKVHGFRQCIYYESFNIFLPVQNVRTPMKRNVRSDTNRSVPQLMNRSAEQQLNRFAKKQGQQQQLRVCSPKKN